MMPTLLLFAAMTFPAFAQSDEHVWEFTSELAERGFTIQGKTLPAKQSGKIEYSSHELGGGVILDGMTSVLMLAENPNDAASTLPARTMTVGAWVSIDTPRRWGGIIGSVRDDGEIEKGWVLGYDDRQFTIGLSTTGADDGNGQLSYVAGDAHPYEVGRWHHVVATYDGAECRLFVDGELSGSSTQQSGDILYDPEVPFVIGAYRDTNENHLHDGRLLEVRLIDRAMSPAEVANWYQLRSELSQIMPWFDTTLDWSVEPFLTWPTTESITVTFETSVPTEGALEYRHESSDEWHQIESKDDPKLLHHFRLTGLEPNEKYFYRVIAGDSMGGKLESELLSFRAAVTPDRPFTFIAIGDTQSQPDVAKRVSDLAYMHRPNLVVHAGDLVDTGTIKSDWTGNFFPAMQPLIGRVPLMPVLGNHEQDAQLYYDYMDLPAPEYYYSFTFGDAEFFMIDGNRRLSQGSEQLAWLDKVLAASTSKWKFAVLHQPPYTSDSNDYGDTMTTISKRGDPNVQNIIGLLEKHSVDICFSGHVHDYERTFPIRDGKVTSYEDGGVVYVTTAGGGGHLENFDPNNTWFGHKKAQYHHLVYVAVNGDTLEFQAIDESGRLFDVFDLDKGNGNRQRLNHVSTDDSQTHDHQHSP
jgi:predicted phosphodiesterase